MKPFQTYRIFLNAICLMLAAVYLSGCATIYGRQNDKEAVFFDANVENATVECSGDIVVTPGNLSLVQSHTHLCSAFREGYESEQFRVVSKISKRGFHYSTDVNKKKWGIWTLGLGILIGWTVDIVSGAMRSLEKDRYEIELKPEGTTGTAGKILEKSTSVGKALVSIPHEIARKTTTTAFDATVHSGPEQLGITSDKGRDDTENVIEGKDIAARLDQKS